MVANWHSVLPVELVHKVIIYATEEVLHDEWPMSISRNAQADALSFATVSKVVYPVVVRLAYEEINIGDILDEHQTLLLARTLSRNADLGQHIKTVHLRTDKSKISAYSKAWQNSMITILLNCEPERVSIFLPKLPGRQRGLLPAIRAAKLKQLYIQWRDYKLPDFTPVLDLISRAAPTLEWLLISGLYPLHGPTFQAAQMPFCSRLTRLQSSHEIDLGERGRQNKRISLYQALVTRHAQLLCILDISPLQYTRQSVLSELSAYPVLETLVMQFPSSVDATHEQSQHPLPHYAYELRLLRDLSNVSSITRLIIATHTRIPDHQNLADVLVLLIKNKRWLPNLHVIIASDSTSDILDVYDGDEVVKLECSFRKLYRLCSDRNVVLEFEGSFEDLDNHFTS